MAGFDRFTTEWANAGIIIPPSNAQYDAGFAFLGPTPPSVELFNAMFQEQDQKDNWLYEQMLAVMNAGNAGPPSAGDYNDLLDAIRNLIAGAATIPPDLTPYVQKIGDTMTGRLFANAGVTYNAGDFVTYDDGTLRVTQYAVGYADVYDPATGLRQWVGNNQTIMSLDFAGNLILANNITALAQAQAVSFMSNTGIYYVSGNPAYYMGRENTTGRWQIVDNARELFGVEPVAGNTIISGNCAIHQSLDFNGSTQADVFAVPNGAAFRLMGNHPNFQQWGIKEWAGSWVYNTQIYPDGGGAWGIDINGNTAQRGQCAATAFPTLSDATLKTNIADWTPGLDIVKQIRTVSYEFADDPGTKQTKYYGVTAQEIQAILPEAVVITKRLTGPPLMPPTADTPKWDGKIPTEIVEEPYEPILAVEHSTLFFAAINAIKELAARLDAGGL